MSKLAITKRFLPFNPFLDSWDSGGWPHERIARLGQQQQDGLVSPTEHESIYSVAWDMSHDPNRVSTTPQSISLRGI